MAFRKKSVYLEKTLPRVFSFFKLYKKVLVLHGSSVLFSVKEAYLYHGRIINTVREVKDDG